jgi:hypothetical protein
MHPLHSLWTWFWHSIPTVDGILVATLAVSFMFMKEIDEILVKKPKLRWFIAGLLVLFGVGGFISDRIQDAQEQTQRDETERNHASEISGLKATMQQEEISNAAETKYLEGQLSVFNQFAPAVVKLAQATETNTRKQYEEKVLTNKELKDFVTQVVKKMRDWEYRQRTAGEAIDNKYDAIQSQMLANYRGEDVSSAQVHQKMVTEMDKLTNNKIVEEKAMYSQFENEFNQTILGDAILAREQLINKLGIGAEPKLPEMERTGLYVFRGIYAGAYPVAGAADYLELFAKKLSP